MCPANPLLLVAHRAAYRFWGLSNGAAMRLLIWGASVLLGLLVNDLVGGGTGALLGFLTFLIAAVVLGSAYERAQYSSVAQEMKSISDARKTFMSQGCATHRCELRPSAHGVGSGEASLSETHIYVVTDRAREFPRSSVSNVVRDWEGQLSIDVKPESGQVYTLALAPDHPVEWDSVRPEARDHHLSMGEGRCECTVTHAYSKGESKAAEVSLGSDHIYLAVDGDLRSIPRDSVLALIPADRSRDAAIQVRDTLRRTINLPGGRPAVWDSLRQSS